MEKKEALREGDLSEETKSLITSLPSGEDFLGKLYMYQGCWYYANYLQGVVNFQKGFKPQETDIILASYPKSGTTWLKALTFAILERSKNHSHDDHHHPLLSHNPHGIVPFLEQLYGKSSTPDLTKYSSSSPRLFATHMPFHALKVASPCKIVCVCRNVKDVLVSYWRFKLANLKLVEGEKSVLESMFESLCSGVSYYGPFWEHVLSYWRGSLEEYPRHVLFMRYEEMIAEPVAQVKRLAEFLDCPFTEEEEESGSVNTILDLCSLHKLSSLEINKTGKTPTNVAHYSFFRKGEVGDWKNHLTPQMANKIDMITQEKFKGAGFQF